MTFNQIFFSFHFENLLNTVYQKDLKVKKTIQFLKSTMFLHWKL